jgi:hypothetical protein
LSLKEGALSYLIFAKNDVSNWEERERKRERDIMAARAHTQGKAIGELKVTSWIGELIA